MVASWSCGFCCRTLSIASEYFFTRSGYCLGSSLVNMFASAAMYACSRGVALSFCALSTIAAPCFTASAFGCSQSWWNRLIDWPQYAIAHFGSEAAIFANSPPACSYSNECSQATPVLNGFCDAALQEIGNDTAP